VRQVIGEKAIRKKQGELFVALAADHHTETSAFYEVLDFLSQNWQFRFHDIPHEPIINISVTVNEDVAKCDDATVLTDSHGQIAIQSRKLSQGLTYDFKLTLYCRT
jgi:hypothetical protein